MSATKRPQMAGEEKPQTGKRDPRRNATPVINVNTYHNSDAGRDEPKVEQHTDTSKPPEENKPQDPPRPPIFDRHVKMGNTHSPRETHYYTPLAATIFARFDENDPREQPAEHAVFIDTRLSQRGFI